MMCVSVLLLCYTIALATWSSLCAALCLSSIQISFDLMLDTLWLFDLGLRI